MVKRCPKCGRFIGNRPHTCVSKPIDEEKVISLYLSGISIEKIAKFLNDSFERVRKVLVKHNIKRRGFGSRSRTIVIPNEKTKLAYVAGLIDGDGWINCKERKWGSKTVLSLGVAVNLTDKKAIEWLKETFKGGCVYSYKPKRGKRNYQWQLHRWIDVYLFLKAIVPYLVIKKDRAKKIIKVIEEKYKPEIKL